MAEPEYMDVCIDRQPYTFVAVDGLTQVWHAPERQSMGVYLWCIDWRGSFLVNYVGKTSGQSGFEGRLWSELKDWRAGRYCTPVDVDAFKRGTRIELPPGAGDHERELRELEPLYRILLAPVKDPALCTQLESAFVNALRSHEFAFQFLCNRDKRTKYRPKPSPIVRILDAPPIVGISAGTDS